MDSSRKITGGMKRHFSLVLGVVSEKQLGLALVCKARLKAQVPYPTCPSHQRIPVLSPHPLSSVSVFCSVMNVSH